MSAITERFNTAIKIIKKANLQGLTIYLVGEKLKFSVGKDITPEPHLIEEIKRYKEDILYFLKDNQHQEKVNKEQVLPVAFASRPLDIPLSFSQERLWFIDQLEGSVQYHIPTVLRLKGKLNRLVLENSLQQIINRHEVLRTVIYETEEGTAAQRILGPGSWAMDTQTWQGDEDLLEEKISSLVSKPFDLSKDHKIRCHLLELGAEDHVLVVTLHHIASDGWSSPVLVKEFVELYNSGCAGRPAQLAGLPVQYADYAIWQRGYLAGEVLSEKLAYWGNQLKGVSTLWLPTDHVRPSVQSSHGALYSFKMEGSLQQRLQSLSREHDVTMFMTLLAAFKVLLYRYSGQEDICVGSPVANRGQHEIEGLIGCFVNTLALRSDLSNNPRFTDLLSRLRETTLDAYQHQDVPFEKVVELVVKERDMSRSPLFQAVFVLQNNLAGNEEKANLSGLELFPESGTQTTAKFDLTLKISEDGMYAGMEYNTDLFKEETIRRMCGHYGMLLGSLLTDPGLRIDELEMLSSEEQVELLLLSAGDSVAYPKDKTILDLFEEQVIKAPGAIALVYEEERVTYGELDARSNQLGNYLRSAGVREEVLVPVCVSRGTGMIVAILGILKAGGAYVPVDPEYPSERIRYMLEDTGASLVLTDRASSGCIPVGMNCAVVEMEDEKIREQDNQVPARSLESKHLAYVIYTSGSTGRPKGVMIEHSNVVRLFRTEAPLYDFNEKDVWTMFHSFCFDFSVWEMYGALFYGGRLVIVPRETAKDARLFGELLIEHSVTVLNQTPSAFYVLQEYLTGRTKQTSIRYVIFGGEALNPVKVTPWKTLYGQCRLINMYGITETTVHVSYQEIGMGELSSSRSVIGRPIPTLYAYVLDRNQNLSPVGVAGELYISGAGVARGYLNLADLTSEKFLRDPFTDQKRMYRTGDMGRWLDDGNLEYLGRMDDQVKMRGYRIELGEIESVLLESGLVSQSVVVVHGEGESRRKLVGYVVLKDGVGSREALQVYMQGRLPEYMIPSVLVELSSMPLTQNGKTDRKALPEPDISSMSGGEYVAPRTQTEIKLVLIWEELLGIERVGIHDNFFELGGDSIKVIRVASSIRRSMNKEVRAKEIYRAGNIIQLGALLDAGDNAFENKRDQLRNEVISGVALLKKEVIESIADKVNIENIEDVYPLSDIQNGMIYASLRQPGLFVYHDQMVYWLTADINIVFFEQALDLIVRKHSILRTGFNLSIQSGAQIVYKEIFFQIDYPELSQQDNNDILNYIQRYLQAERERGFDITEAPLWRAALIRTKHNCILVFQCHHAILDGWSIASMMTELNNLYLYLLSNKCIPSSTAPLKSTYKDFIIDSLVDKKENEYRLFWKKEMEGYKRLDIFLSQPENQVLAKYHETGFLDRLKDKAKADRLSLKSVFLGAYIYSLSMFTSEDELTVGLVTNNRPAYEDGDKLLGCFLNTIPFRCLFDHKGNWKQYYQEIENHISELRTKERTTLSEIKKIAGEKSSDENPFFDALFNYVNFHVYDTILEGLSEPANGIEVKKNEKPEMQKDLNFAVANTFLECIVNITGNVLNIRFFLRKKLKSGRSLEDIMNYFESALDCYLNTYSGKIRRVDMIAPGEREELLEDFAGDSVAYPKDKTILDLFEEQVIKAPGAIALVYEEERVTYGELDARSSQLGNYLRSAGVREEVLVPVCVSRGTGMIVAILGILKAGGAYVPVDPEYPSERIRYMLEDTGASLVLTDRSSSGCIPVGMNCAVVEMEEEKIREHSRQAPSRLPGSDHLAYVIYTSGSTGRPKGVMIEHRSVVNLLTSIKKDIGFESSSSLLSVTTYSFDISYLEFYLPLVNGGKLIIVSREKARDVFQLQESLSQHRPGYMQATPSTWKLLIANGWENKESIKMLIGGETVKEEIKEALTLLGTVWNVYGPTETTIWSTIKKLEKGQKVTIGKPIANTGIYILGKDGGLRPVGVEGEICISGDGLARGYYNNAELTAKQFEWHSFDDQKSTRLYHTGDLGKWLPDGNIDCLGRIDTQIKIRGYRVEAEEVAYTIYQSGMVSQALVLLKLDKKENERLVAYVIPGETFNKKLLVDFVRMHLPEYMVPSSFETVDMFPLLPNGKIDRNELQRYEIAGLAGDNYQAPGNGLEEKLVLIWQDLLDVKTIGIHDNFFELGGHSLLITGMASKIYREFGVRIDIQMVFEYPTILDLAGIIANRLFGNETTQDSSQEDIDNPAVRILAPDHNDIFANNKLHKNLDDNEKYFKVTHQQKKEYVRYSIMGFNTYNLSIKMKFENLDKTILKKTFYTIFERHESLRSAFCKINGEIHQYIYPSAPPGFQLEIIDMVGKANRKELIGKLYDAVPNTKFDFETGPFLSAKVIEYLEGISVLLITIHHLICDATSKDLLQNEIDVLYSAYKKGEDNPLPPLKAQLKDYVSWVNNFLNGGMFEESKRFYERTILESIRKERLEEKLMNKIPLPNGGDTKEVSYKKELSAQIKQFLNTECIENYSDAFGTIVNISPDPGSSYLHYIEPELSNKLRNLAKECRTSNFMAIVSTLSILFSRCSTQKNIRMHIPFSTRVLEEFQQMLSWLTSEVIVCLEVGDDLNLLEYTKLVTSKVLEASSHRFYPNEKIMYDLDIPVNVMAPYYLNFKRRPKVVIEQFTPVHNTKGYGHFNINCDILEYQNCFALLINYNRRVYTSMDIETMLGKYILLLEAILQKPHLLLSSFVFHQESFTEIPR
jgi:amino acid adenylation domain-containing protein